jgi:hypothetical protein
MEASTDSAKVKWEEIETIKQLYHQDRLLKVPSMGVIEGNLDLFLSPSSFFSNLEFIIRLTRLFWN